MVRSPTAPPGGELKVPSDAVATQDLRRLSVSRGSQSRSSRPPTVTPWSQTASAADYASEKTSKPAPSVASGEITEEIMPETVLARIRVSFSRYDDSTPGQVNDSVDEWNPKILKNFRWREGNEDSNSYDKLIPKKAIREHMAKYPQLQNHDFYIKYGSCCVKGPPDLEYDRHYAIIDDYDKPQDLLRQWVIREICGFINEHAFRPFTLDVHWEFSSALLTLVDQPEPISDVAETIKWELERKMHKNFEDELYIPKSDLDKFLSRHITDAVINDDSALRSELSKQGNGNSEAIKRELADFGKRIHSPPPGATKLLLLCVHSGIEMTYLKHWIMIHGYNDDELSRTDCNNKRCTDGQLSSIRQKVHFFFAPTISEIEGVWLQQDKILPVKVMEELGKGSSGRVLCATIDASHHGFSADPSCQFALKEFEGTERGRGAFGREIRMLQHLRPAKHAHIVMHITAWKSKKKSGQSYILYPMAKYHLRSLLAGKPLNLDRDGMLWFLRQVKGLADATFSIHYLKKENVNLYTGGGMKESTDLKMVFDKTFSIGEDKWCSHQDIKPENILVFEKLKGHHPFFKLSDLGSGYFNDAKGPEEMSDAVQTAQGTRVYYGPEIDQISERKGVSRAFDMWALGCCYLELLIWLFKPWTQSDFADKRLASERVDDIHFQEASYWSKNPDGSYDRKSAVNQVITKLRKKHCASMPAFLELIEIIEKLLEVKPENRKTSKDLCKELEEL